MLKKILLSSMLSIVATGAFAVSSTVTSKDYVDDLVATKQAKIPAAGATGVGAGDSVITYTGASGTIGERGIYSDPSSYDATTDADKIITASALRGAVSNISTTETSKLTCYDNDCTLWSIGTQTAYSDPIKDMLSALVDTNGVGGTCYKRLSSSPGAAGACITQPTNYGDWGVLFTYNNEPLQISGISACSTLSGTQDQPASDQSAVQSDYENNLANAPATSPIGENCYCKMTDPSVAGARWVSYPVSNCVYGCATRCSLSVRGQADFRRAIFGLD